MVETKGKSEARQHEGVLGLFDKFEQVEQGQRPSWLTALHKAGIAHFAELGFPTIAHEEWRFTNVAPLAALSLSLPDSASAKLKEKDITKSLFPGLTGKRVVFVDGAFSKELSSKDLSSTTGVKILSLEEAARTSLSLVMQNLARHARYDENSFAALNTAFVSDGAVILVPPGQKVEEPIYLVYLSTCAKQNVITHPRTLVVAQRGSEVRVIEHYVSLGSARSVTNAVTEIVIDEAAYVEHCKVQEENTNSYHVATIHAQHGRNSRLLSHSISIGALLARNNITCTLDGEGIESTLNGLYLTRDSQLVDHHTAIHHNKPNCNSHEYYHGILDGKSTGVFNGKIFVRPEAQKTDAKQNNRNLLLSDEATINTKPQLEIFADDVKCTHGATVGQLDQESIFYLRARGIGLETARKMLLHAFASEIVNRISIESIRARLDEQLFDLYER